MFVLMLYVNILIILDNKKLLVTYFQKLINISSMASPGKLLGSYSQEASGV
jgi:hypothetical protein